MAAKKRTEREVNKDRELIADLYLQGYSYRAIAKQVSSQYPFNLSHQVIAGDIKHLLAEWRENRIEDIGEAVQAELEKLARMETEAWKGWYRSCEDTVTVMNETKKGESGCDTDRTTKVGQSGNPAFLVVIDKCISRRADLLGLNAPKKREITGAGGGPIQTVDLSKLSDKELDQLGSLLTRAESPDQPSA